MSDPQLFCLDEQRRLKTRQQRLNGLDYLEVEISAGQPTLHVYFLGKAPQPLSEKNILILGGRRVRNIHAVRIELCRVEEKEQDDCLTIFLDRAGDFSTYTLCLVEVDADGRLIEDGTWQGRPRYRPLKGFDPRYACLDFSFQAGCSSDLDCQSGAVCPPAPRPAPEINYLAKDYASFRRLILDRLALIIPDWTERHIPDLGVALVDVLAYAGDYLSYYQDAVATEAYLNTARLRVSVRRHARLVDYNLHEGCNARAWVFVWADDPVLNLPAENFCFAATPQALPAESQPRTVSVLDQYPPDFFVVFEPVVAASSQTFSFTPGHNELNFYTWGDVQCCLPRGATSATLAGPIDPPLQPGDFLLFEEVRGPLTNFPADADPAHRHVVRLSEVREDRDPLNGQAVVEIAWGAADALPFPLCISAIGPAPQCALIEGISVARGNIVLVDHGRTVGEDLEPVPDGPIIERCEDCCDSLPSRLPVRYRPRLKFGPLTYRQPLPAPLYPSASAFPAALLLNQDVHQALPAILSLQDGLDQTWAARGDLFASQDTDPHFVVEVEDDGRAVLRFGDDTLGKRPTPATTFHATYRVGSGPAGNVGAGSIRYLLFRGNLSLPNAGLHPRNPLPAQGGTLPETLSEARLTAPDAFRTVLRRAIIPEDYAAIVMRDFAGQVQRAAAALRWNGSWHQVLVAIDALGGEDPDPALLAAIQAHLRRFRRINHDVIVQAASYVPLEIELSVCIQPHALRGHVRAACLEALSNRLLPDGRPGYFHPDNLTFGQAVYLSPLIAVVTAIPGVESVTAVKFQRLGGPAGQALADGLLPLGPLEIARLDNDSSFPENGQIKLSLGGGR
jgi:hypothetical protein